MWMTLHLHVNQNSDYDDDAHLYHIAVHILILYKLVFLVKIAKGWHQQQTMTNVTSANLQCENFKFFTHVHSRVTS